MYFRRCFEASEQKISRKVRFQPPLESSTETRNPLWDGWFQTLQYIQWVYRKRRLWQFPGVLRRGNLCSATLLSISCWQQFTFDEIVRDCGTHLCKFIAAFARVCRLPLDPPPALMFWYFCSSASVPLSACIFGGIFSALVCWWIVVTDESESLDESDVPSDWLLLTRDTFIFGDCVNDNAVVDSSLLLFGEILLLFLMSAFKLIRLSFCTLFFATDSSSSSSSIRGKVNTWLWHNLDEDELVCELDELPPLDGTLIVQVGGVCVVAGKELKALVSAEKDVSGLVLVVRVFSPRSGVVWVGGDDVEVVSEAVVIPIRLVETTVSMSGDERAVMLSKVGVWTRVESFSSIWLLSSAGAPEPLRQGKQHRNSVEQNIVLWINETVPF